MSEHHRILVTGASGFVGSWLMNCLREFPVDGKLDVISAGRGLGCDIELDIVDKTAATRIMRDVRPTSVVHLAAIAAPLEARKDPSRAWDVNFWGTINLAMAVQNEVPDCRFIFASSSEVYGKSFENANGSAISEDWPLKPMTVYGATKAAADIAVGQMHFDGLRSIRFRPFNHTGPGQTEAYVIPAFASQVARIEAGIAPPIIEVGNLEAKRDFLDVRDVVRAYALAALGKGCEVEGKVFNLALSKLVEISSVLDILVQLSDRDIEVVISPERVRKVEIPIARGDSTSALRSLDWKPQFELEDTISTVLSDWRNRINASI